MKIITIRIKKQNKVEVIGLILNFCKPVTFCCSLSQATDVLTGFLWDKRGNKFKSH